MGDLRISCFGNVKKKLEKIIKFKKNFWYDINILQTVIEVYDNYS